MPLVQEIGAGLVNGNSYVSAADVKAFVGSIALPSATDDEINRAAILATRYLDGHYRDRLKGYRVSLSQALEWPRYHVDVPGGGLSGFGGWANWAPSDSIPQAIKDATCELSLRAITAPLAADIAPRDRVKTKKIDVLTTEYVPGNFQTSYPVVDQLVSRFLKSSSDAIRG